MCCVFVLSRLFHRLPRGRTRAPLVLATSMPAPVETQEGMSDDGVCKLFPTWRNLFSCIVIALTFREYRARASLVQHWSYVPVHVLDAMRTEPTTLAQVSNLPSVWRACAKGPLPCRQRYQLLCTLRISTTLLWAT